MALPMFSFWKSHKEPKPGTAAGPTQPQLTEAHLKRDLQVVIDRFSQIDASGNPGGAVDLKRAALLKQCHQVYQQYCHNGGAEHKQLETLFKQQEILDAMDPLADHRNSKALEEGVKKLVKVTDALKSASTSKYKV